MDGFLRGHSSRNPFFSRPIGCGISGNLCDVLKFHEILHCFGIGEDT